MDIDNLTKKLILATNPKCPLAFRVNVMKEMVSVLDYNEDGYFIVTNHLLLILGNIVANILQYDHALFLRDDDYSKREKIEKVKNALALDVYDLSRRNQIHLLKWINLGSFETSDRLISFLDGPDEEHKPMKMNVTNMATFRDHFGQKNLKDIMEQIEKLGSPWI